MKSNYLLTRPINILLPLILLISFLAEAAETDNVIKMQQLLRENLISGNWAPGLKLSPEFRETSEYRRLATKMEKRANQVLNQKLSVPTQELYLDFSKTGNRIRYEKIYFQMTRDVIQPLAFACLFTGEKKYLDKLEEAVNVFCDYPTWILPAHDLDLANVNGTRVDIDLFSAENGQVLAAIHCLLGDKLSSTVKARIRHEVEKRILTPFEEMTAGKCKRNFWFDEINNWNPVCLSGVTGCILALEPNRERRIKLLSEAIRYSMNYLKGFAADGYCSEGIGYFNYGFGAYLNMAAMLNIATKGQLNMLEQPQIALPASYPERIMIVNNWYPAFADCNYNEKIAARVLDLRDLLLKRRSAMPSAIDGSFSMAFLSLHLSTPRSQGELFIAEPLAMSTIFRTGGVAILRSGDKYPNCRIAAAIKGGHNAEEHNHNDLGAYVLIVDGKAPVVLDAGSTVYTRDTFSPKRYQNPLLGSYGHSVPRPAGVVQSPGRDARAVLVSEKMADDSFQWTLDLKSAYPEARTLKKLERDFNYSRLNGGSFAVTDRVAFTVPETYESAIITFGTCSKLSDSVYQIEYDEKILFVTIDANGVPFEVKFEALNESTAKGKPVNRLAVRFLPKVENAVLSITFRPEEISSGDNK